MTTWMAKNSMTVYVITPNHGLLPGKPPDTLSTRTVFEVILLENRS